MSEPFSPYGIGIKMILTNKLWNGRLNPAYGCIQERGLPSKPGAAGLVRAKLLRVNENQAQKTAVPLLYKSGSRAFLANP